MAMIMDPLIARRAHPPISSRLSSSGLSPSRVIAELIMVDSLAGNDIAGGLDESVRLRLAEDARSTQNGAQANRAAYVESVGTDLTNHALDFDAMVRAQAQAETASLSEGPRFIAFASLSMPPEALRALVRDMGRAGGVTVLRGFPQGDSEGFKKRLAAIWSDGSEAGSLGVDPRLFRAFDIKAAPSFVMLSTDFSPCDGFDCRSVVPPHDRIAGNVSVAHVLETFARGGGPGAALARLHLARLEGDWP